MPNLTYTLWVFMTNELRFVLFWFRVEGLFGLGFIYLEFRIFGFGSDHAPQDASDIRNVDTRGLARHRPEQWMMFWFCVAGV